MMGKTGSGSGCTCLDLAGASETAGIQQVCNKCQTASRKSDADFSCFTCHMLHPKAVLAERRALPASCGIFRLIPAQTAQG